MTTKLVIFGITGDLSKRKLLPALRKIISSGAVEDLEIIGVSRSRVNTLELVGKDLKKITRMVQVNLTYL